MKISITISIAATVTFAACVTGKNKLTYEFPTEMNATVRADYINQWEKGKVLYEINCAKCHTQKIRGHDVVPDFKQEQLVGYALRLKNPKHESHLTDETVNTEELGLIMTFLNYKKKNTPNSKM